MEGTTWETEVDNDGMVLSLWFENDSTCVFGGGRIDGGYTFFRLFGHGGMRVFMTVWGDFFSFTTWLLKKVTFFQVLLKIKNSISCL